MISAELVFEMAYWKRWKLNFIGSYLDSVGLLFAIILLMKFRSPEASITSPEYAFFIIGFLSSYLVTAMFARTDTPKNYAKYDIYDWIVSSQTSMLKVLIAERVWCFIRYMTPGLIGLTVYFWVLGVSLKVYSVSILLVVPGWLGCVVCLMITWCVTRGYLIVFTSLFSVRPLMFCCMVISADLPGEHAFAVMNLYICFDAFPTGCLATLSWDSY